MSHSGTTRVRASLYLKSASKLGLAVGLCTLCVFNASTQTLSAVTTTAKASTTSSAIKAAPVKPAPAPIEGLSWIQLSASQQQALRPLSGKWDSLPERQKRKWLALVPNYHARPASEQAKLHSRMTEWASLSTQQRAQARLNFAEAGSLSAQEKKAKWEAYQALNPEEKQKLVPRVAAKPAGATTAVKPVPAQKLVDITPSKPGGHGNRAAKSSAIGSAAAPQSATRPAASLSTPNLVPSAAAGNTPSGATTEPAAALAPTSSVQTN